MAIRIGVEKHRDQALVLTFTLSFYFINVTWKFLDFLIKLLFWHLAMRINPKMLAQAAVAASPIPIAVSRRNSSYFCHILRVERVGADNNEVDIQFAAFGDGSLGPLQVLCRSSFVCYLGLTLAATDGTADRTGVATCPIVLSHTGTAAKRRPDLRRCIRLGRSH